MIELQSQLVEPGAKFTWRCLAEGRPDVTYSWLKDTKKLVSGGGIEINKNTLTILRTDERRDNGMYQCTAENTNGVTYSIAQLKVASKYYFLNVILNIIRHRFYFFWQKFGCSYI